MSASPAKPIPFRVCKLTRRFCERLEAAQARRHAGLPPEHDEFHPKCPPARRHSAKRRREAEKRAALDRRRFWGDPNKRPAAAYGCGVAAKNLLKKGPAVVVPPSGANPFAVAGATRALG